MFLLRVTDDRGAVTQHLAESFPYQIGRSAAADLQIEAPGVWEIHAVIQPGEAGKFDIAAEGSSLLHVNGQAVPRAPLSPGDELTLGAVRVLVSLSPARQPALRRSEAVVWLLLLLIFAAELAVIILAG